MILEHLVAAESKEVLKTTTKTQSWADIKRTQEQIKISNGPSWKNLSNRINKATVDYSPNNKKKIHVSPY